MEEYLAATLLWTQALPLPALCAFVFFSCVMENVFPPYPGDTVIVFAGFVGAQNQSLVALFTSGVAGSVLGALIMYLLGEKFLALMRALAQRNLKPQFVQNALAEMISEESIQKSSDWFNKYGLYFVIVSRFSAGVRFFVSIIAGISRVRLVAFLPAFTLGVLLWNGLLTAGGYYLGKNWVLVLGWLKLYNTVVITAICVALAIYALYRILRSRRNETT